MSTLFFNTVTGLSLGPPHPLLVLPEGRVGFNLNEGQGWVPVRRGGCVVRHPRMRDGEGYNSGHFQIAVGMVGRVEVLVVNLCLFLSFWVVKIQLNHWTKRMVSHGASNESRRTPETVPDRCKPI